VLEDLFDDWHRAADTFECSDDPVVAIGGYVRAKMELSQRRPLGSKVWASEIIHGAGHMQDILNERVKPWLDSRVIVIDNWIARGLLAPVDAKTFMFMIWATTQHYADFDAQVRALKGERSLSTKAFDASTDEVVNLMIRACGARSPG
jgi:TetR/AcrR family transcriptional regulator